MYSAVFPLTSCGPRRACISIEGRSGGSHDVTPAPMEMEGMMHPSLIRMKLLTALPNIFSVKLSWPPRPRRLRPPTGQNKYPPLFALERILAQNIPRPRTSSFWGSPTSLGRVIQSFDVWKPFSPSSIPSPSLLLSLAGGEGRKEGGESINFPGGPQKSGMPCRLMPLLSLPVGGRLK